jgi:hypothetical protein
MKANPPTLARCCGPNAGGLGGGMFMEETHRRAHHYHNHDTPGKITWPVKKQSCRASRPLWTCQS